jgi:glutaminase
MIQARDAAERWNKIIGIYNEFSGRELSVNEDVYKSESDTNQHNRAIAWLLNNVGGMYSNPTEAVDIYTRQCSVSVTASDLAAMGATIANGGAHPKTTAFSPPWMSMATACAHRSRSARLAKG